MMRALQIIVFCTVSYASALDIFIDGPVVLLDCKSHGSEEESTTKFHTTVEPVDPKELFEAARYGNLSFVNAAITGLSSSGLDINWHNPDFDGYTALHIATRHPSIVAALLDAGADPNVPCDDGRTPVYEAATWGHTGALELMLAQGGDPNKLTNRGGSPLMAASYHGQVEAVRMLIQTGAHVNYARPSGTTALHDAAIGDGRRHNNHEKILLLLLQNGADKSKQDGDGKTAADLAREWLPRTQGVGMPDKFGDESVAQLIEDY